jgi:hypothetical protein
MKMLTILSTTLVTFVTAVITVTEFTKWYLLCYSSLTSLGLLITDCKIKEYKLRVASNGTAFIQNFMKNLSSSFELQCAHRHIERHDLPHLHSAYAHHAKNA